MCVFLTLLFLGPRFAMVVWWLLDRARFDLVFDTFLLPLVGFIFVPWTTLMYVIVGVGGVEGWDWLWLFLAFLIDLLSYGGGAWKGKDKVSSGGSNEPAKEVEATPVEKEEPKEESAQ